MTRVPVRGRFAPSPSGRMHLGNVWCALAAWLAVRSQGGTLVLRIEDLDPRTADPAVAETLIDDLVWLGLDWDEGPYFQSRRADLYAQAIEELRARGLTYPCFCSRADLHVASAPHASDGTPIYAGTCRDLAPEEVARRTARLNAQGRGPALRLRVPAAGDPAGTLSIEDATYGPQRECLAADCGDFVLRRTDGIVAYQLAVVVDDGLMGVNQVVRGQDLLGSVGRQVYLQRLLGYPQPAYAHVPMLMAPDGTRRLSKRDRDCDLGLMRARFGSPEVLLGRLAHLVGLRPTAEPAGARDLLDGFAWEDLRAAADARREATGSANIPVPAAFFEAR